MSKRFTVKTFASVGLMAVFSNLVPQLVRFEVLNPVFTAMFGGLLMGTGMLILFRHRAGRYMAL